MALAVQILGTILCLFFLISSFCIFFLWRQRYDPRIFARVPCLAHVSALSSLIMCCIESVAFAYQVPCTIKILSYSLLIAMHIFPTFFRGLQFFILTNQRGRRKLHRFKSKNSVLKMTIFFFLFESIFVSFLFIVLKLQISEGNIFFQYLVPMLLSILIIGAFGMLHFLPSIPDAFKICQELKVCSFLWIFFGVLMLLLWVLRDDSQVFSIIMLVMNLCTFTVTIICPIIWTLKSKWGLDERVFLQDVITWNPFIFFGLAKALGKEPLHFSQAASSISISVFKMSLTVHDSITPLQSPGKEEADSFCEIENDSSEAFCLNDVFLKKEAIRRLHELTNRYLVPEISLFLHAANHYRTAGHKLSSVSLYKGYLKIVNDYIEEDSPFALKMSPVLRNKILECKYSSSSFDDSIACDEKLRTVFDTLYGEVANLFISVFDHGKLLKPILEAGNSKIINKAQACPDSRFERWCFKLFSTEKKERGLKIYISSPNSKV